MIIKAVKFRKDGFTLNLFVFGGEEFIVDEQDTAIGSSNV